MWDSREEQWEGEPEDEVIGVPTEEELAELPRWARVAFAARCARRVQPLYAHFGDDLSEANLAAVETAIDLSERAAASASIDAGEGEAASNAADAAVGIATGANAAALTAVAAIDAAMITVTCSDLDDALPAVCLSAISAAAASENRGFVQATVSAIWLDFDLLRASAERDSLTDDSPVPPDVFGPIWPNGAPEGWPPIEQT